MSVTAGDWDLTPYFPAPGGGEHHAFRDALERDAEALGAELAALGALDEANLGAFRAALLALEDAAGRAAHLGSYLGCLSAADARDEAVAREVARLALLRAALAKRYARARDGLARATDAAFEELVADPALAHARHFLARLREDAHWRMAPELEELAADLEVTGLAAWSRLYDRVAGTLELTLEIPGGPPRRLPVSRARTLLGDPRAEVRAAALRGANAAWASQADVAAACLNAIAGARLELYRRRGVAHFLDPALFDAGIERATLDALMRAVADRRELPRRYLRRKARLLGRERLGFQDLEAPLSPAAPAGGPRAAEAGSARGARASVSRLSYGEARARIAGAFAARYAALARLAERAFERRWIDWSPRPGKRPGGFCTGSPLLDESRIFLTFDGAPGDVSTLAHELGHAFHGELMRGLPAWPRRYPMTLAETASTFAERILADAALADPAADRTARLEILDGRLRDAAAFLLNIPMRFEFECRVYEERASGELPASRLCELVCEAQRAWYGDSLAEDELDPWFWASKLHFYIAGTSFYNFPYSFGYLLSLGLFARFEAEGEAFLPRYEALLRGAGSDTPEALVRRCLGADLARPDFWHASIDAVERDLARLEDELGA